MQALSAEALLCPTKLKRSRWGRLASEVKLHLGVQQVEGSSVVWCYAVFSYSSSVKQGWIPFILIPSIQWKLIMNFIHVFVAVGFGKNRSGCYGEID